MNENCHDYHWGLIGSLMPANGNLVAITISIEEDELYVWKSKVLAWAVFEHKMVRRTYCRCERSSYREVHPMILDDGVLLSAKIEGDTPTNCSFVGTFDIGDLNVEDSGVENMELIAAAIKEEEKYLR